MACTGCNGGCNDCGGLECGTGAAGLDGLNAFTDTTATFLQPAFGDPALNISVSALGQLTGIWGGVGQWIFIEGAGFFKVVTSTTTLLTVIVPSATIQTYNYTLAANGATIAIGEKVSPAGIEGPAGAAGSVGATAISVLDLDSTINNTTNAAYATVKSTPIPDGTIGTVQDVIRVEMDVIGDVNAAALTPYSVKLEFGGTNIMFEGVGAIDGYTNTGIRIFIDLVVSATDEITPHIDYMVYKASLRTGQVMLAEAYGGRYVDAAAAAAITLGTGGPMFIKVWLKSDGTRNVSLTYYKVTKLLKS